MKLVINLSSKRIHEAIKEGIVLKSKMTIEVDLSALSVSDREILSRNISYRESEDVFYATLLSSDYNDYRSASVNVPSEKITDIIDEMRKLEEARAAKIANKAKEESIKEEIDNLLKTIEDDQFKIERYDSYRLYFRLKEGSFSREMRIKSPADADIESMLEFVKSPALQSKLAEVKADYAATIKAAAEKAAAAAAEKAELEAGRTELLSWAKENGSELLKLRIKHEQNWQSLSETEWALAHVNGEFKTWDYDPDSKEDWTVMNATLEQLNELEKAQAENPECAIDIMRSKFDSEMYDVDDTPYIHRTFIRCIVPMPTKNEYTNGIGKTLYREITDASEE